MNDDRPLFSGGFEPHSPPRAKSLSDAVWYTKSAVPFSVRPGSSSYGFMEGPVTQLMPKQQKLWVQLVGKSESGESTKYENLFPKIGVDDLTRANKTLVHGGSDSLKPSPDTWHGKSFNPTAMTGATLLRLNETTTAFGSDGFDSASTNVGAGIMAEVLHQKWSAKSSGSAVDSKRLLSTLTEKFPQLDSVDAMRKQGSDQLMSQVDDSRLSAAVSAGRRALAKGLDGWQVNEYVQKKFSKHGLGELPGGWMDKLRESHG